ncbi:MAG: hypothetical protein ABIR56_08685 [Polaromonas sp.]
MNPTQPKNWTPADIVQQAVAMLAIGNVAVHRAQAHNRAKGIPNYYSIGGRIVSDSPLETPEQALGHDGR